MTNERQDSLARSAFVHSQRVSIEGKTVDVLVTEGELEENQLDELEDELLIGYGLPDSPNAVRYHVTIKSENGSSQKIMVTQFRVFEFTERGWELRGFATPELRQKLAEWSKDWPRGKSQGPGSILMGLRDRP